MYFCRREVIKVSIHVCHGGHWLIRVIQRTEGCQRRRHPRNYTRISVTGQNVAIWSKGKTHLFKCSSHLLSLFQKSRTITRSGTLYRRPLIRTSSVGILRAGTVEEYSGSITSILPLLYCRGLWISIGVACCLGIRRLGAYEIRRQQQTWLMCNR